MDAIDSILTSVKKMLGIEESYEHFDPDIIMHINSVFLILNQLGVGPKSVFHISGENDKWRDFISDDFNEFALVKSYVYMKVRILFDPPINSAAIESINNQLKEFEWRLMIAADNADDIDDLDNYMKEGEY